MDVDSYRNRFLLKVGEWAGGGYGRYGRVDLMFIDKNCDMHVINRNQARHPPALRP